MKHLRARWLFPGEGPPIPEPVLTIEQGVIVSVREGSAHVTQHRDEVDLGSVALIPGLINSHTHLEFSDLQTPIEPRDQFADWIAAVIHSRRDDKRDHSAAIRQGLVESQQSGVVRIAEIATSDWIFTSSWTEQRPHLFIFRELLGLHPERVDHQLAVAESFLKQALAHNLPHVGLSPHAPYSLHPLLFQKLINLAVAGRVPVAMHLAESPAELELLHSGTGPLVDLFTRMGIWQPEALPKGLRPLHYLRELARAPRGLVIHGNLLDEEELRFLASSPQLSVVYCPRTHLSMQKGEHPWRQMKNRGVNVLLGTDSRASNPDLSLWNELRHLHWQTPDLPASELLQLATANAAKGLGWSDLGRLAPGFRADFCVVPLSQAGICAPEKHLFEFSPRGTGWQTDHLPGVPVGPPQ